MRSNKDITRVLVSCITLSALCLLPMYKRFAIVHDAELNYFRPAPYTFFLPGLTFAVVVVAAAVFFCIAMAARRLPTAAQHRVFAAAPLLLIPSAYNLFDDTELRLVAYVTLVGAALAVAFHRRAAAALSTVLMALAPLLPIQIASAVWQYLRQPAAAEFQSAADSSRSGRPSPSNARRVVWIVFDEWDDELSFDLRPRDVEMPALDRLKAESVYVARAMPPAEATLNAMPALFLGKRVQDAVAVDFNTLRATVDGVRTSVWEERSNVFTDAADAGLRTAMVGWYHPYCRVLGEVLDECATYFPLDARASFRDEAVLRRFGVAKSVWRTIAKYESGTWIGTAIGREAPPRHDIFTSDRAEIHRKIQADAVRLAADPRMGLIVIHWNLPHLPGIYNRSQNQITLTDGRSNYFDNLELMDAGLAKVREAMTASGVWDSTIFIATSDHPMRQDVWANDPDWSKEEAALSGRRRDPSIPFLIKAVDQRESLQPRVQFDITATRALLSAIHSRQVESASQVAAWLERHTTTNAVTASSTR